MPRKKKYKLTAYGHQHMPFLTANTVVEISWTPNLLYWEEM